jgi:cell division protein FtsB
MALMKEIRRRIPYALGQVLGCLVVGYFAYHLVEGDRGLLAMRYLKQEIAQTRTDLAVIENDRKVLDARVALLRPSDLDPDMLDERARVMLNLAGPGEIVIQLERPFLPQAMRGTPLSQPGALACCQPR